MIFPKIILLILCTFAAIFGANTIYWQTTHEGSSSGNCRLESNKINITIHPYYLDVEEEAVIVADGSVWWGDSKTLEIYGEFELTPGTAVRSMLLWNGNKLLKAKLRDKKAADSLYEATVDRSKPIIFARDPSIIEQIGENRYRFRIYPVEINASRRLRILYSVPMQAFSIGPSFAINTAFSAGSVSYPENVSLGISKGETPINRYILNCGNVKRELQYDATYLIPSLNLRMTASSYWGSYITNDPNTFYITPDSTSFNRAYSYTLNTGNAAGTYSAVFATTPDSVRSVISQMADNPYAIEARVTVGTKSYIMDVPFKGCIGAFIKSTQAWDNAIHWTIYNTDGFIAYQYSQLVMPDTVSSHCAMLPLFWGSKYTLDQGNKGLGALYGFVDSRMSLLALEADTLPSSAVQEFEESGVPKLLPSEIILAASQLPTPPSNDVMFEIQIATENILSDNLNVNNIIVLPSGLIHLQLKDKSITAADISLYDLRGRLIKSWRINDIRNGNARLMVPTNIKGRFVIRIKAGKEILMSKAVFR